jgi:hypothetical protein
MTRIQAENLLNASLELSRYASMLTLVLLTLTVTRLVAIYRHHSLVNGKILHFLVPVILEYMQNIKLPLGINLNVFLCID